ncbi:hypothetical protein Tco_0608527 [Tanacetum coccineum]
MFEVEQLRSRWSRIDPRMSPLSSLGIVTNALLSQDTLPELQSKVEAEAPLGPLSLSGVHSVRTHLILLSQPLTSSDPL